MPRQSQGDRGRPVIQVSTSSSVFLAPPGGVKHDQLTDTNWVRQLDDFLHRYGRARCKDHRDKTSETTLANRRHLLTKTFRLIMKDKRFTSLSQVKPRHLPRIIELWEESGVGARARINYYWHVRWFFKMCGIETPPISEFEKYAGEYTITRAAVRDRSWKGNGVDFDEVYNKIHAEDPVAARLLKAIRYFGLRVKESICLNPHEADRGQALAVTKGTKTGRARTLEFENFAEQDFRKMLDEIKGEVDPGVHLAWSNRTLKQGLRRIHHLMEKHGVTHKGLGVSLHGLRHDFAIDRLQELTGVTAPVRGGLVINYRALSEARRMVSQALGHNRVKITTAYYGSFLSLGREQLRNAEKSWERMESSLEVVRALLEGNGVNNLYWVGPRSLGSPVREAGYEFVFEPGLDEALAARLAAEVSELIEQGTGCAAMVRPWSALSSNYQALYQEEGIPLFCPVSPMDALKARLEEQQKARLGAKGN